MKKKENEFKSKLEEIMPAEEPNFPPSPAFGPYKRFLEHAIPHPAKANVFLLQYLILNYTKPGETILDPMAGSGSTCVVAALHNRNAIGVELEPKFFEWMQKAKENVEKHPTLLPKGKIINILGDARKLTELLKNKIDSIVTSPPYAEANRGGGIAKKGYEGKYGKDEKLHLRHDRSLSDNPNNISNLSYGVDTIITSPPYSDSYLGGGDVEKRKERLIKAGYAPKIALGGRARNAVLEHYSLAKENLGNLPHGNIDAIISPLCAETLSVNSGGMKGAKNAPKPSIIGSDGNPQLYSESENNIGNLPLGIDAIITSPPYEHQLHDSREKREKGCWKGSKIDVKKNVPMGYSENSENIGNLKSSDKEYEALAKGLMVNNKPTYLSEMLKVYREMWEVLKPNGLAIIIIKPFIRNKKVVDLPYHTYLLLRICGFTLEKLYKLRLKAQSFWRILYSKKFPDVPLINHEYILVMRKI